MGSGTVVQDPAKSRLAETVERMFRGGRGLLAVDERAGTLGKKFEANGIENTPGSRGCFRGMLFKTEGIERAIGGVIMNEETIAQDDEEGVPLVQLVRDRGIAVGVKLDKGLAVMNGKEHATLGEEDLEARLGNAARCGAVFAKWRSVFRVGEGGPSPQCVEYNLRVLGRFVLAAQAAGLVPVVEPEISFEGAHLMGETESVALDLYAKLVGILNETGAYMPGLVLKLSFLSPGRESMETLTAAEVGRRNAEVLRSRLPHDIGGVVFLSGGHSQDEALEYLDAVKRQPHRIRNVSFSFARAITNSVIAAWAGKPENVGAARTELIKNVLACKRANGAQSDC